MSFFAEEMDKMRSVLQQMQLGTNHSLASPLRVSANHNSAEQNGSGRGSIGALGTAVNTKKQGVSAESAAKPGNHVNIQIKKYPKSNE